MFFVEKKSSKDLVPLVEKLFATVWAGTTKGKTKNAQKVIVTPTGVLSLDKKAVDSLESIVRELGTTELGTMFSQSYLAERMFVIVRRLAKVGGKSIQKTISTQVAKTLKTLSKTRLHVYYVTVPISGAKISPHSFIAKVGKCWVYSLANHSQSLWLAKGSGNPASHLLKLTPPPEAQNTG